MKDRINLAPLDLAKSSTGELIQEILESATIRRSCIYTYATADTVLRASIDHDFRSAIEKTSLRFADGMGAAIHSRVILGCKVAKSSTHDFFADLIAQAIDRDLNIVFIGGRHDTAKRARDLLAAENTDRSPEALDRYRERIHCRSGYFGDANDEASYLETLNLLNPSLVVIGMGQPIQEVWAHRVRQHLPNTTFLCVGGLFDLVAKNRPSPPMWMRRSGLEWSFRLATNPGYTWRRYLLGLPMLAMISCAQMISVRSGYARGGVAR